ncbi:hypothetical protein [Paludisphaera mucosa]|uniref:Uncharacterized protein n=1 Tax=Paludisphaera mucosa TaxID=3030827 RepID=A0ABT6F766_9BACT|nr:hypothetical protein [Paludisphaera mucosa]MDG3003421.1 hypothetical protein [Paludisphaera mucosa]
MVALIVASLGGTLHLVVVIHRRSLSAARLAKALEVAARPVVETAPAPAPEPPKVVAATLKAVEKPKPPPPQAPAEDPTPKALAQLNEAAAHEAEEARRLDREVGSLEQARLAASAEAEKWRRREMLVKQQVALLDRQAQKIARDVDAYAAQRDVLARERDALKAAVANAPGEGSYAVLPYQGENGTWKRPIVIECNAGSVTIRPDGPTFSLLDLSGLINPRSSPVVVAIARELLKIQTSASPDGSPVTPYFVFLVRPDGIRAYYEARARLEPLGIAFGYELVEKDLKIHVPNFDDVDTWDGSPSIGVKPSGLVGAGAGPTGGGNDKPGGSPLASGGLSWPGSGTSPGQGGNDRGGVLAGAFDLRRGQGAGDGGGDGVGGEGGSPDEFVWPSGRPGAGPAGSPEHGGGSAGGGGRGRAALGSASGGRGSLNPGRRPGSGTGSGGSAPNGDGAALGSVLDRLPDFERSGGGADTGDVIGAKPGANELGEGAGTGNLLGDASGGRRPIRSTDATGGSPISGGTVPGRSWKSDGTGRRSTGGAGSLPTDLQPAPLAAAPATGAGGAGGLMWGGSGGDAPTGPRTPQEASVSGVNDASAAGGAETRATGDGPAGKPTGAKGIVPSSPAAIAAAKAAARLGIGSSSSSSASTTNGAASPGLMLGADPDAGSHGGGSGSGGAAPKSPSDKVEMEPLIKDPDKKRPTAIEVPFEIVLACGADGVTIQPGGYRITSQALKDRKGEDLLVRNLEAVALKRAEVDPLIRPRPRVKFLVEDDGAPNFWEARRQVLFSGLNWPMTLQVAGVQNPRPLERGTW